MLKIIKVIKIGWGGFSDASEGFNDDLEGLGVGFGGVCVLDVRCQRELGVVVVVTRATSSGQRWVGSAHQELLKVLKRLAGAWE